MGTWKKYQLWWRGCGPGRCLPAAWWVATAEEHWLENSPPQPWLSSSISLSSHPRRQLFSRLQHSPLQKKLKHHLPPFNSQFSSAPQTQSIKTSPGFKLKARLITYRVHTSWLDGYDSYQKPSTKSKKHKNNYIWTNKQINSIWVTFSWKQEERDQRKSEYL